VMSRLATLEKGEGRTAGLMLAHSFFMGLATVFFETAASALFLARFGSASLPYVYVAAALVNTAAGLAYTRISARTPFARLMAGTLWLLVGSVIALRLGLTMTGAAALTFFLLVWYRALSILTDLEYWAVAARLYDVRQAKRLFPVIGTGEVVARIGGSFAVPFLVLAVGVENLLTLSALALGACLAIVAVVLRGLGAEPAARPGAPPVPTRGMRELLRDRYVATLVGLAALGVLAKYLVDFAFLEQMRSRYADATTLASTFALFSGGTQALSLLTRVAVAGPLLRRYGVRAGLLVLPMAHVACTALVVGAGWVPAFDAAVFWLVLANQGIYKTLKHPIDNPSFKVLYQPLRRGERLSTQIAIETIVTPVTIGLAGGLMLLFTRGVRYDPTVFAWAMLAAFVAWAALGMRAGREYAGALVRALRGRIVDDTPFVYGDAPSLAILKGTLAGDRPGDVLFALELLEKAGDPEVPAIVVRLLDHPFPEVRRAMLSKVESARTASARPAVARRAASDASASVRAAALRCLSVLAGPEAWPALERALEDPDPEVRRGALAGLLAAGAPVADQRLAAAARSESASERAGAARVLGEGPPSGARSALLRQLLADPRAEVRRAALQAAGRARGSDLWPIVSVSLADPACRASAASALVAGGDAALAEVEALFAAGMPTGVLRQAARVAARIKTPRAAEVMRRHLGHPAPRVRDEVLEALRACGWTAGPEERDAVLDRVREEVREAAWASAAIRDLGSAPEAVLLRDALDGEVEGARRRVLLLLGMAGDPAAIERVRDALAHGGREKRAYALEVLDVTLSSDLRAHVLPLVEDLPPADRAARLADEFPQAVAPAAERVREVISRPESSVSSWTRACAMRAAGNLLDHADSGGTTMLTIEKVICLKAVPMFAEASEEILADVAAILEEREVAAGEVVFEKGEAGDSLYVIVHGQVRVFDGDRTITHLGEHDIFGELALLDPEPRVASVAAVTDTRLLRLDREGFAELMAGNIEIVRGVLHVLCERLRRQAAIVAYAPDAPRR
jgi:HEAT repeat protein